MKVRFYKNGTGGSANDNSYYKRPPRKDAVFITRDGNSYESIIVGLDSPCWEMTFCHELAHVLLCRKMDSERYCNDGYYYARIEMMAERLAKSICKPEYWDDDNSIETIISTNWDLMDTETGERRSIRDERLKIIPMNKGIRIR